MSLIVKIGTFVLNILFSIMKLLPVQKKVTYISRQMNTIPLDFQLVIDNYKEKDPTYQHVVLAKMIPDSILGKIGYCFHMLRQMYHIATSEVVILDTYCILVSLLKQRESLVVIQMWHALGAFKKFGYSILDQEEGSSSKMANLMKMHHNYTYVLSSSEYAANFFAEAFHVSREKMKVFPLPKTDLLLDENLKKDIIDRIYMQYPRLKDTQKKIIVYAPTFRKGNDDQLYKATMDLINKIDFSQYELILKKHPLTTFLIDDSRIIEDHHFTSLEMFHIADAIVTDYSAVVFESSLLNKPLYFYAFDYDEYMDKRSFYIDYYKEMPGPICRNAQELMYFINDVSFDKEKVSQFRELMIAPQHQTYTDDLVDFIRNLK